VGKVAVTAVMVNTEVEVATTCIPTDDRKTNRHEDF
jgi:hypothetical protein